MLKLRKSIFRYHLSPVILQEDVKHMADGKTKKGEGEGERKRLTVKNTSNEYLTEKEKEKRGGGGTKKTHTKTLSHELSISWKHVEAYRHFKLRQY